MELAYLAHIARPETAKVLSYIFTLPLVSGYVTYATCAMLGFPAFGYARYAT